LVLVNILDMLHIWTKVGYIIVHVKVIRTIYVENIIKCMYFDIGMLIEEQTVGIIS